MQNNDTVKFGLFRILLVSSILLLGACSANIMVESPSPNVEPPAADKAVIVFMRSSFVASAIDAVLFEVVNGEIELVGGVPNGTKVAHVTEPGEKVYMGAGVGMGSGADFMLARVEKGKTYYSILRPNWGSGAFIPTPIKTDGTTEFNTDIPEFGKWVNGTRLLSKKPDSDKWFQQHKDKFQKMYERYWEKFNTKTADQIQERTMMPSDGS